MIIHPPADSAPRQKPHKEDNDVQDLTYAERYPRLVGLEGFLALFVVGIIIATCVNFYQALTGFADTSWLTPDVADVYPNLRSLVTFENIMQFLMGIGGVVLVVNIIKRRKMAVSFALIYFFLIALYTLIDLDLANTMFADSQIMKDALAKPNEEGGRAVVYSVIWFTYFLVSRRVKATLTRVGKQDIDELPPSDLGGHQVVASVAPLPERFAKPLSKLENVALILDKGCRTGQIPTETIEKAQTFLSSAATDLLDSKSIGTHAYIIYEVQSLIHWANGDEVEAQKLARSAAGVKGDDLLLTQTANKILRLAADTAMEAAVHSGSRVYKRDWRYYVMFTAAIFTLLVMVFSLVNISIVTLLYLLLTVWLIDICMKVNRTKTISKASFNIATVVAVLIISLVLIGVSSSFASQG